MNTTHKVAIGLQSSVSMNERVFDLNEKSDVARLAASPKVKYSSVNAGSNITFSHYFVIPTSLSAYA